MDLIDRPPSPEDLRRSVTVQVALTGLFCLGIIMLRGGTGAPFPPWWLLAVLVASVAVGAAVALRLPHRLQPLAADRPADELRAEAALTFARVTLQRGVATGVPLVLIVFSTFVTETAGWAVITVAPLGLVVMAAFTWPTLRSVALTAAVLEAEGAETGLLDAYA